MPFLSRFWASLSMGERLAVGGALFLLVICDWILGDLLRISGLAITQELGAAEIVLLALIRHARPGIAWPLPYAVLLAGFSVLIVIPTISDFLGTLGDLGQLAGGTNVLGDVLVWLGAAAVAYGAYLVWKTEPA
ncbi:MAG TPA: hypothetical protein VKR30_11350 [Candidatus Limnocylindrales bacterium]|nr:hypothetical protein [Candidatus Limnocylindrales bacterium]